MYKANKLKDVHVLSQNHHHTSKNATLHVHDHEDESIAFMENGYDGYDFFFLVHTSVVLG